MSADKAVVTGRRSMLRSVATVLGLGGGAALVASPAAALTAPSRVRRATASAWLKARTVLQDGELAYATDTGVLKVGDGYHPWSLLPSYVDESHLEAALARRLGAALVYSRTPPASPTKFGLPVVWIDASTALTPVPALPVSPTFDDSASTYTIPTGVVGVNYTVQGVIRTPGKAYPVSPVPSSVSVVAVAQPGYSLIGDYTFVHDFPDPTRISVLTSDTFVTGGLLGALGDVLGRTTDAALGGVPMTWGGAGDQPGVAMVTSLVAGAGRLSCGPTANSWRQLDFPGVHNTQVEFDLLGVEDNGSTTDTMFSVALAGRGISVQIGEHRVRIQGSNHSGGSLDLLFGTGGAATPLGHWTIRMVANTLTVVDGAGTVRTWNLDPATYATGAPDAGTSVVLRNQATLANGYSWAIGRLVVKKIGF